MANFFPRWSNWLPLKIAICGVFIVGGLTAGTWYYVTPKYTRVVYHAKPHSMAWCLECHRHPENFLRPQEEVFNLDWKPDDVKPVEFVSKYGQPKDVKEDWTKKKKLT